MKTAILNSQNGGLSAGDFAEARHEFQPRRWSAGSKSAGEREGWIEALDERRRLYEQRLIDLEFEHARALLGQGEHAATVDRI